MEELFFDYFINRKDLPENSRHFSPLWKFYPKQGKCGYEFLII
jgi:hypothetical protein